MPKKENRKQKGGFFEGLMSSASDLFNKAKSSLSGTSSSNSQTPYPSSFSSPQNSFSPPQNSYPYGGKGKTKKRNHRGGFSANTTRSLASDADSISGIKTAQPHNWVGGKTRKRRRHSKSRKH
jgi:hypothetical protein